MKSKKLLVIPFIILSLILAGSVILNTILFNFSRQYYLQLNGTRLDPLGLSQFPKASTQPEQETRKISVIFFGDSRIAEWPMPEIEHFQFVNRGIGAQTSTQVMLRYDAHVKPLNPDILLVQVCINDLKTIPLCNYTGVRLGIRTSPSNREPKACHTLRPCLRIVEM